MRDLKKVNRYIQFMVGIAVLLTIAYLMEEFDDITTNTVIQALMRGF